MPKLHGTTRAKAVACPVAMAVIKRRLNRVGNSVAVLAAGAALAADAAGAGDCLVHDPADGARATPALGAAAEAAIDLTGRSRRLLGAERRADVLVTQNVARTDNHGNPAFPRLLVPYATIDT